MLKPFRVHVMVKLSGCFGALYFALCQSFDPGGIYTTISRRFILLDVQAPLTGEFYYSTDFLLITWKIFSTSVSIRTRKPLVTASEVDTTLVIPGSCKYAWPYSFHFPSSLIPVFPVFVTMTTFLLQGDTCFNDLCLAQRVIVDQLSNISSPHFSETCNQLNA